MSAEESTIIASIIAGMVAVIVAVIRFRGPTKNVDVAVAETKIKHIEEHVGRLEKEVRTLDEESIKHEVEIDRIKGIIDDLKKEVNR